MFTACSLTIIPYIPCEAIQTMFLSLFLWLFVGLAGMAYFMYGKKQQEFWFMIAGLGLMIFPMCFSTPVAVAVSVVMLALPFAAQRWF
jgi:hypothetical protein